MVVAPGNCPDPVGKAADPSWGGMNCGELDEAFGGRSGLMIGGGTGMGGYTE